MGCTDGGKGTGKMDEVRNRKGFRQRRSDGAEGTGKIDDIQNRKLVEQGREGRKQGRWMILRTGRGHIEGERQEGGGREGWKKSWKMDGIRYRKRYIEAGREGKRTGKIDVIRNRKGWTEG